MKCTVFIATSVDGFIAKSDDSVDWLQTAGDLNADMGDQADMGMNKYMSTVDCIIMGRKTMDVISKMNLSPEQWPYGNTRIIVLSRTLTIAPENMRERIELYSGDLTVLVAKLEQEGFSHAYIDGGSTIQAFLKLELINEITITRVPILLGEGKPLFGKIGKDVKLVEATAVAFPNGFVQVQYGVCYF